MKTKKTKKGTKKHTNGAAHAAPSFAPPGGVKRARHKEKLPCKVDGVAIEDAGKELAKCEHQRADLKQRRRNAMAGFKEELSGIDERAKEAATTIDMHTVTRDVWCVDYLMPDNAIHTVREDTGEVVNKRPAEGPELNEPLKSGNEPIDFPDAPDLEAVEAGGGDLGEPDPPFGEDATDADLGLEDDVDEGEQPQAG